MIAVYILNAESILLILHQSLHGRRYWYGQYGHGRTTFSAKFNLNLLISIFHEMSSIFNTGALKTLAIICYTCLLCFTQ